MVVCRVVYTLNNLSPLRKLYSPENALKFMVLNLAKLSSIWALDVMSSGTAPVFFTKKKIVFITLTLAVFVVFIALLMKYFFNIEMNQIIATLQRAFAENRLFFLWLVLLVGFPIFNCFWRIWPYYLRLKDHNIYVEWYNWIIFCFITFLISSITPFAIGSEPYIIYWINKRGLSTKDAASIVASVMVLNPFVQVLIT